MSFSREYRGSERRSQSWSNLCQITPSKLSSSQEAVGGLSTSIAVAELEAADVDGVTVGLARLLMAEVVDGATALVNYKHH